jgi:hypothetical protein
MSKQHNPFTNHEVAFIRENWPTRMPMSEILENLSRHTENSITCYANKVLGLKRPTSRSAFGSPRKQPSWERLCALLETGPMTQAAIAAHCGFSRARASELLRAHPGEAYVERWSDEGGGFEAYWALGNKPHAPIPKGVHFGLRVSRANPFAAALGLVEAPKGNTGRVFIHLTDSKDDEFAEAA